MENNKEDLGGVEFISPSWGLNFEDNAESGQNKIWEDPFVEDSKGNEEDSNGVDFVDNQNEPLLEKDVEIPEENNEDVPSLDNPVFFIAKQAIADGLLPDDVDIPEDVGIDFLYEKYKEAIVPIAQQRALEEAERKLQSAGIKDEHISLLQAIENDTPIDEIYEITKYKKYASAEIDDEDEKLKIISTWYDKRGLSEKEKKRNLDAITLDDEIDSEFEEARKFFGQVVENFEENQIQILNMKQQQEQEIQRRNSEILHRLTSNYQIGEEKLSKSDAEYVASAIYSKNPIQIGNEVYNLSPYEQFYYALNNDFEFSLRVFKEFLLSDKKTERIKSQVRDEVESDWLAAYNKAQKKSSSTTSVKRKEVETKGPKIIPTETGGTYMEF
jgi:hypothetical protein